MIQPYKYKIETYTLSLPARNYIKNYRDVEGLKVYCLACPNYAKTWACPPFEFDIDEILFSHKNIFLIVTKVIPEAKNIPFSESGELLIPERKRLQKDLLRMEKEYTGYSLVYTGTCLYCPKDTCTRVEGKPCRHPKQIRPSLEACGFDIGRTTSELFNIELQWARNTFIPEYLLLVCAFFHNKNNIDLIAPQKFNFLSF